MCMIALIITIFRKWTVSSPQLFVFVLVRYVRSVNYLQSNNMQELVFFCNLESYFLGLGLINTPLFNTFVMISCISYHEKVVMTAV